MDKLRRAFSTQDDETSILPDIENGCSLGWGTRIRGFIICFVLGIILSLLGSLFLWLPHKGLVLFGMFYTLGNVFSIGSTVFLMGPVNQMKRMFEETRIFAALIMLLFMALTICAVAWWKNPMLCLIFCICQSLALTWYSLSYIPYARTAVKSMLSSMC